MEDVIYSRLTMQDSSLVIFRNTRNKNEGTVQLAQWKSQLVAIYTSYLAIHLNNPAKIMHIIQKFM